MSINLTNDRAPVRFQGSNPLLSHKVIILFTIVRKIWVFAIYFILRKNYKNSYHLKKANTAEGEVVTITLSEEMTFLNKASVQETLNHLPPNCKVIIDGAKSTNIDYDVLEIIQDFKLYNSKLKNITVETINIPEVTLSGGH